MVLNVLQEVEEQRKTAGRRRGILHTPPFGGKPYSRYPLTSGIRIAMLRAETKKNYIIFGK